MKKSIDAIYMVHDELLYELFNLKFDTIQYQIINGIPYLVNVSRSRTFEIGFRVRLDKKLDEKIESGVYLNQIDTILADDIIFSVEEELLSKYGKSLCLSNFEKYLINILLDKALENKISTISLKEIEMRYRHKAMSRRYITLNKETYKRYLITINSLIMKELYLKTNSTFRKSCYGVNNICINQKLLNVSDFSFSGSNNLEINYSFGILGTIIKNCKRYSTLAPTKFFRVNTNQVKSNLVAMYISRQLFIERGIKQKSIDKHDTFIINAQELVGFIDDPFEPILSNFNRYARYINSLIYRVLKQMKYEGNIYDFKTIEEKKSNSRSLSQEEIEREEYFKELNEYWGEKEEVIRKDIPEIKTIVFLTKTDYDDLMGY